MWNTRPFMSADNLEMVSYTTRPVAKALAEGPHWLIIETYWNTAIQQNNIWSIAFEARTKEILKRGMLKPRPTLDITHSNGYQV